MNVLERNNVSVGGNPAGQPMVFAHGYGCDQNMWRFVTPAFEDVYRIVLFDHVGYGGSVREAWDPDRYDSLDAYARDVLEICHALELSDVVFVGHSVSTMIGVLAAVEEPDLFDSLVLIGPSPRYIDDDRYSGGFQREDIDGLLDSLESNYLGWSASMAPLIMGNPDRPELADELTNSFCRADPAVAHQFARVTFLSDNREDLSRVKSRCLVLQCSNDAIAPQSVGEYVHRALPDSEFNLLDATGHCPNLSAPEETVVAMKRFLRPADR